MERLETCNQNEQIFKAVQQRTKLAKKSVCDSKLISPS